MSAVYVPGHGVLVAVQGSHDGVTVTLPDTMSIAAIERHLQEVREFLG